MADMAWINLDDDGDWRKWTKAAMQSYMKRRGFYTRTVDGDFGYQSQLSMQKLLKAGIKSGILTHGSFYSGRLDGDAGDTTWVAWRDYVSTRRLIIGGFTLHGGVTTGKPSAAIVTTTQRYLNVVR